AFGIAVPLQVSFSKIPVVGSKFPGAKDYGISQAGVWVLSHELDAAEIPNINCYIEQAQTTVPPGQMLPLLPQGKTLSARVLLSARLDLGAEGTDTLEVSLGSASTAAGGPALTGPDTTAEPVAAPAATGGNDVTPPTSTPDGATWMEVQKT